MFCSAISEATDQCNKIVADLENLRNHEKPDEVKSARSMLREIIGEIEVKEEPRGIFTYTKLIPATEYNGGVENALSDLYIKPIPLK